MKIDEETQAVASDQAFPECVNCRGRSRVNVLMFGDGEFDSARENKQDVRTNECINRFRKANAKVAIIEIGAGMAIQSIRRTSERLVDTIPQATLLRINPEHPDIPTMSVGQTPLCKGTRLISMTSDSLAILRCLDALVSCD